MKRIILAASIVVLLAGCAGGDPEKVVFNIRAGYDAGPLVLATNYESLPRCDQTGDILCSDSGVVSELRKADLAAKAALDAAEDFVRNHPELNAEAAIDAARAAVDVVAQILAAYSIGGK